MPERAVVVPYGALNPKTSEDENLACVGVVDEGNSDTLTATTIPSRR